jgi:peptidoglycan/LPS O-acetylase OafA/YrhL
VMHACRRRTIARMAGRRLGYVPALDGLRGLAIALVVGRHYFLTPLGGGGAGVNLFFVLSGFLITTLLLEEHAASGGISLARFYERRARRLLPALAVMLAGYLVGAAALGGFATGARAVLAGGFYTANFVEAFWPSLMGRQPIGPLWSLALEEQFYLIWPVALLILLRLRARPRRIRAGLVGLILAGCTWRIWLTIHHAVAQRIMTSPDSHADALLTGVLVAYILQKRRRRNELIAMFALLLFALVAYVGPIEAVNGPAVDIASAGLVVFAVQERSWLGWVLSRRPLVRLGVISYSLYLWHMVVLSWFHGADRLAAVIVSVSIASLSYRFVEQPFRRRRLERGRQPRPAIARIAS